MAVDDVRAALAHLFIGHPQPGARTGTKIGNQDVAGAGNFEEGGVTLRILQVQRHIPLIPQDVQGYSTQQRMISAPEKPDGIATCRLHANHFGAQVAENLGSPRAHDDRCEIQDPDACQGTGRLCLFSHADFYVAATAGSSSPRSLR